MSGTQGGRQGAGAATGWPPGSATGVGSLPGTDVRDAMHLVLDTVPAMPFLPELPARGPGADTVGRALALAGQVAAEWGPNGWAVADRPGRDLRRAASWLGEDLDVLAELLDGWDGPLKLQVCGPWTLAATVELRNGRRAVSDPGAARDLAQALAEGVAAHVADVARRVPRATVLLQLDEPALPSVLVGSVPTPSGLGVLRSVDPLTVEARLCAVLAAVPDEVVTVVHCCAASPPLGLLRAAGARAVSLDATLVRGTDTGAVDALAETLDAGTGLLVGVVPALDPGGADDLPTVAATVDLVRRLWQLTGRPADGVHGVASVVVTPTCGLAGATSSRARAVLDRCRAVAAVLDDDPERPVTEAPDG